VQQAGHYYSTSQCPQPSMVFNEQNVHGQCIRCNMFLEGNRQGYLKGLLKRYGKDYVGSLEITKMLRQSIWGDFEYDQMIKLYTGKVKDYEQ
jgi:hypothetical protein